MSFRKRNVLPILFVTLLIDMIGIGMLIPIVPALFTDASSTSFMLAGYSHTAQYIIAGLITALFGFMQFLAAPLLGELSDVYGRKKLLTLGVGVLAISQLLFSLGVAVGSLALLLFSRAVAGVAGANFSIAQAAIADVTEPHNRQRNFGLIGAAFGLGFIIGPFLGGTLAGVTGNPALPFLVAGILGVFNVLFISFMLPETHLVSKAKTAKFTLLKGVKNIAIAARDVNVKFIYGAGFLQMLGFGCYTSFVAVFLVERFALAETSTGIYYAVVGGWIVFTQLVLVRFFSRLYSERTILNWSLPLLGLVILSYTFAPSIEFLYIIMPFLSAGVGLSSTSFPSLISKGVSKERQGAALGISGSLQALSQGVAPLIAGVLAGIWGISSPFILGTVFIFGAWALVLWSKH